MKDFIFWKRWTNVNKTFLYFSLTLLAASFCLVFYFQSQGTSVLADPILEQNVSREKILLDAFERNYYQNNIEVELFLNTQDYVGGPVKDNVWVFYTFLFTVTVSLCLWLASITKIVNKTWYFRFWILDLIFSLGPFTKIAAKKGWLRAKWYKKGIAIYGFKYFTFITVFAFALLALNLDALNNEPNAINIWFLLFLIPIGGLSLYFYSFNTKPGFTLRFLTFLFLFSIIFYTIDKAVESPQSLLHLVAFGVKPLSILAIAVIFYSGYRAYHFFLFLSASEKRVSGKQNLINFIIISALFFFNALFLLLKDLGYTDLSIMYLSPAVILATTLFLGLWSQRLKALENQQNILVPHSLFIYLAGSIITVALLFFAYGTMNEGLISLLERMIMYANVCVGGVFMLYTLVNFASPMLKGFPVFNKSLHGSVFNFSGVFFIAAGIIAISMNSHYFLERIKWKASNYNAIRDYYAIQDNTTMRDYYALKAKNCDYYGLKSNYFISKTLPPNKLDSIVYHLSKISDNNATPFVFADRAKAILNQNKEQFYDAIFTLQDGLAIFPESSLLRNNLGVLYMNYMPDSSYKYLMEGLEIAPNDEAIATNLLKFKAKGYDRNTTIEELDSLIQLDIHKENKLYQSNRLAVARLISSKDSFKFPGNFDSLAVNKDNIPLLYNYLLYLESQPFDKTLVSKIKQKFTGDLAADAMNQFMAAYGIYQLRKGEVYEGVKALSFVIETCYSYEKPYYANLLAKLLLQNGFEDFALANFIESDKAQGIYRTNDAYLNRIFLYGKYDKEAAVQYLNFMIETGDSSRTILAKELLETFTSKDVKTLLEKDDRFKLRYIHFNPEKANINQQLLTSIQNPENRAIAEYELHYGGKEIANPDKLNLPREKQEELNYLYLRQLVNAKQFNELEGQLNRKLPYHKKGYTDFIKGYIAANKGDTTAAKTHYKTALKRQFFNPDVLLKVVDFYEYGLKNEEKAYQLLLSAVDLFKQSIPFNKAYALMCIRLNYNSFALSAIADLEGLLPPHEFKQFMTEVDREKVLAAEKFNNW